MPSQNTPLMAPAPLRTIQRSLITRPVHVYLPAAALVALFALGPSPTFMPLILLLATVRLYVTTTAYRQYRFFFIILMTLVLSASMTFANISPSYSALPAHKTTVLVLLAFLTTFSSAVTMSTVYLDTRYRATLHTPWSRLLLFPTIWSTSLFVVSSLSPVGRLATWSPVSGLRAYSWLRPYFATLGIDWVVAAWAVVLQELLGMWIMGPQKEVRIPESEYAQEHVEEGHLVSYERPDENIPDRAEALPVERPQRNRSLLYLSALLCLLAVPSYYISMLPIPMVSPSTTALSVACALPLPSNVENENNKPGLEDYIHATRTLTPLARIVLWPEGAVRFETREMKDELIAQIQEYATTALVAVSFEDIAPSSGDMENGPRRHGIMLIDKDGLQSEYFKRNLVPFVERRSLSSRNKPEIIQYELVLKRNSRKVPIDTVDVPVVPSISLDFASNFPFSLSMRPSLILGAANTWHPSIGTAMWQQAKARAEELGSALLWCDGGDGGVSGVAAQGISELLQVGSGSWVRTIGLTLPVDEGRTVYGFFGAWLALPFIWGIFGVEWIVERAVMNEQSLWQLAGLLKDGAVAMVAGLWRKRPWGDERQPLLSAPYSDDD